VDEYEQLIRKLIESGDDKALGILLCVCGVNSVTVDPQVLAGALKVTVTGRISIRFYDQKFKCLDTSML